MWAAGLAALPGALSFSVLVSVAVGCAPEIHSEPATKVSGLAVDAETGEPIAGAWIFEVVPKGASGADVRRISRARATQTNAAGRFHFPPASRGFSFARTYPPRYHLYDPSYGLIRGGEAKGGAVRFAPSLRDAHLRQADASSLCVTPGADAMSRKISELACPPARPELFENGRPRATGAVDAQGRRTGRWYFFREDGSVIAEGDYESGAAVGDWAFKTFGEIPSN